MNISNKNALLTKTFGWLFVGLLVTFASAFVVSLNDGMMRDIYNNNLHFIFVIAEIVIAIVLATRITKMKKTTAILLYIVYTLLTGLTLSMIFLAYKLGSIAIIFAITAGLFGIFAVIGKYTKIDLSKLGVYLFMALIAVIILSIINIFVQSDKLNIVTCIISVVIFLGYIAYDINRLTKCEDFEGVEESNLPILFAFELFIDFINLFLRLLELFGDSNN